MIGLVTMANLAVSHPAVVVDAGCKRFASYDAKGIPVSNAAEATAFVTSYMQKDIDPLKAVDETTKHQAADINSNVVVKTTDIGVFAGIKVRKAIADGYYSLADLYIGKTASLVFYEKKGRIVPLYFVGACQYNGPELVFTKTNHGSYLTDRALAENGSTAMAPIYWKISGHDIVKTEIDNLLMNASATILTDNKLESLTLAAGFDIKALKYTGRSRIAGDCMACYSGPMVTIKLRPKNGAYTVTSEVEKVKGERYQ